MARWLLVAVAAVALIFNTQQAEALNWTWNYVDASTAEGSSVAPLANSGLIYSSSQYLGETVSVFTDPINFQGYTVFKLTSHISPIFGALGGDGTATYGQGIPPGTGNHEISGVLWFQGTQDTATTFTITASQVKLFFDSGKLGAGGDYTVADFKTLGTFVDGLHVESGDGTGAGTNAQSDLSDGASKIFFTLEDILSTLNTCGATKDQACGQWELHDPPTSLTRLGIVANDNDPCGLPGTAGECLSSIAALIALGNAQFGKNVTETDLTFLTQNDGSLVKDVIPTPVPATLLLLGLALSAAGIRSWKRRS